jgi:hypothetical protein
MVLLGARLKSTTWGQPAGVEGSQDPAECEELEPEVAEVLDVPDVPDVSDDVAKAPVVPPVTSTASAVATSAVRRALPGMSLL